MKMGEIVLVFFQNPLMYSKGLILQAREAYPPHFLAIRIRSQKQILSVCHMICDISVCKRHLEA